MIIVALVFSVPYLGVQLRASGFLFNVLTDGLLSIEVGMWVLSAVVFIYVASGGLRAVAYVDTLQCILLAAGIVIIGVIAVNARRRLGRRCRTTSRRSPRPTTKLHPGRLQPLHRDPGRDPVRLRRPLGRGRRLDRHHGLTYMFALMGIQSAPAFSMWAFSNHNPAPFAPQQVWALVVRRSA